MNIDILSDKQQFDNNILCFQSIIKSNIIKYSSYKMGATFIGIKTNISGTYKLHFYILLFPFPKIETTTPYCHNISNFFIKDLCLDVDESFYIWVYNEMKKQNNIVILSLESNILNLLSSFGDTIINIKLVNSKNNNSSNTEIINLDYQQWFQNKNFNNSFSIQIINPFTYMVPFPVKPIILQTLFTINNFVTIMP
jgi:hypothetical protein